MRTVILLVVGLAATVSACSGPAQPDPIDSTGARSVATVTISPSPLSLQVGKSKQLTATVRDSAGNALTDRTIAWRSSDTVIARVSTAGMLSARNIGNATISAEAGGKSGSVAVTVAPVPVATVSISPASPTVQVGGTSQLSATTRDSSGATLSGRTVSWNSSNTGVATVSSSGLLAGVTAGSATITATSEGISSSITATVTTTAPPPVSTVTVTLASSTLTAGQNTQATAVLKDASGNVLTGRTITWSSSNTAVATVNGSGVVSSVAAGSTSITATSEGKSGSATLNVNAPPVATVTVSLAASSITAGQTTQATAVLKDANGNVLSGRSITWTSANTNAATVSSSGLVTAIAAGSAQISATSEGKSGSATVTVTSTPPTSSVDTIFYDGFESGTFSKWQDGYNAQLHRIVTDASNAFAGSRYLEATYPAGQDGGWLTSWFMPGYDSAFVRLYVKFESTWSGSTKIFGLYGSRTDNQWSAFGQAGKCPTGSDFFATMVVTDESGGGTGITHPLRFYTYYPAMSREPDGVTCWGRYGNGSEHYYTPLEMTTGAWHKLEFWVKLNAIGQSDAVQRIWLDGQLKGEWAGIQIRTSSILKLNSIQLSFSQPSGAPKTEHMYIDEVLVTNIKGP